MGTIHTSIQDFMTGIVQVFSHCVLTPCMFIGQHGHAAASMG
jgi:hypothetical protein